MKLKDLLKEWQDKEAYYLQKYEEAKEFVALLKKDIALMEK